MFKLVQPSGKALSGIMTSAIAAGQPLKIIKTVAATSPAASSAGGSQEQQQQQVGIFVFVLLQ